MTDVQTGRDTKRTTIVEVAARLLQDEGRAAVTTRRVAETAGVQAPTIYRLFGDKDGLLEAVAEHAMATFVSTKTAVVAAAAADGVDPLDDLQAGWRTQIDFGVTHPELFALLSDPNRVTRSPAAQAGLRVLESRVHRVALAGRLRVSEPRAVGLIQAAGIGTIQTLLATAPDERDPDLADAMYDAVRQQILTETDLGTDTDRPSSEVGRTTATVVAFRALAPRLAGLTPAERRLLTDWLDRAIAAGNP